MPSESYSFLDVTVLDAVRKRFAAGDALAILSTDMEEVIWANGPGAALFGYSDIESMVGASPHLPPVAKRHILAVEGFPDIGVDHPITVRLAGGIMSRTVGFMASAMTLPDGEKAILLAVPAAQAGSSGAPDMKRRALSGFTQKGQFLAFVDGNGDIEAASTGFEALAIPRATLARLVAEVAYQSDRIVKRLIAAGDRSYPSGLARLADEPVRHLLVVIDEEQLADEDETKEPFQTQAETAEAGKDRSIPPSVGTSDPETAPQSEPVAQAAGGAAPADAGTSSKPGKSTSVGAGHHDHWYFSEERGDPTPSDPQQPSATEEKASADGSKIGHEDGEPAIAGSGTTADEGEPVMATHAPETIDKKVEEPAPTIDRNATPRRFVWRTDAEGRFSAVSPEFAAAVGQTAADVLGRRFRDVAVAFGLDPSGEISGLLERRDTWSGRSVLWPLAGTGLKVPVDLAALPVYGRSRTFEGFRGFGVARPGDAVDDPEKIGLALVPNAAPDGEQNGGQPAQPDNTSGPLAPPPHGEASPDDPFKGEVPALSIVPKQDRRFADKVIRLAEHRQPANDKGLSTVERSAFREIGERLKKDNGAIPAEKKETASGETPAESGVENTRVDIEAGSEPHLADTAALEPHGSAPGESAEPVAPAAPTASTEPAEGDPDRDLRTPATEPGKYGGGSLLDFAEEEDAGAIDDGANLDEIDDTENQADLARLDGVDSPSNSNDRQSGRSLLDFADDDDSTAAADFRDARDDETLPVETTAATPDYDERPARQSPPLRAEGFLPSAFAATGSDTSLMARLPVPVLIHSGDALHYANEEFFALTGYKSLAGLEAVGGLDALFVDPYTDDTALDTADRSLRLRTADGRELPVDALLRSVPWRDGKALMMVIQPTTEPNGSVEGPSFAASSAGVTQPDVSELKARVAEMRTIIDTATDGVVLIDPEGNIQSISRPAEALFGFDSDDVAGKPFASLFAIESQRAARDYLAGLSEPGVASVLNDGREVIGREAEGRFIPLFMTIGRLPEDSGFCAVVRDITQWKRAEEDLTQARAVAERASSQKTDFLARISHEIRTPLNAIIGFSELMVDEKFGPVSNDRYRDYLRDINRSGNHVLDLVNDLLDISKIEAGQQEMDYEAVSLNDTLAETVALMQPQANRERVIIRSSFASRVPEVVADLRSIRQIALNVLSNAIRYTQAGGQVIVSTAYEASGDVVMRVRDTGVGMNQAEIEQALKPFKQINALRRGRGDGTGLGLPLTKAMVEANRARFTISSTPGEGTLVEVAFPSTRVLAD
ncbi:PAS domain S-box protein [Mesorhizobium sp. BE184]|uniref:PAS domain S-box protein n=1 Tax=Mesorhizobium sp. BE184 TaxID=2817714 RepID=UPI002865D108|nr:PAS domain S-box protein [Mesorhizobium sp. BE184]MDR7033063.1 PAS domain S-box-containing protein [Mesorhizobium sp. BE184]